MEAQELVGWTTPDIIDIGDLWGCLTVGCRSTESTCTLSALNHGPGQMYPRSFTGLTIVCGSIVCGSSIRIQNPCITVSVSICTPPPTLLYRMSSDIMWQHVSCVLLRSIWSIDACDPDFQSQAMDLWYWTIAISTSALTCRFQHVSTCFNMFQHVSTVVSCHAFCTEVFSKHVVWQRRELPRIPPKSRAEQTWKEMNWKHCVKIALSNCVTYDSNGTGLGTVKLATYLSDLGRIFLIFEPCLSTRQMVNLQPAPWSQNVRDVYVILFQTF